ncbi:heme exporter protein CcmD [Planktotalea sp.]|uniref:heme exporter protein CcmD n=1 Tax=Planktotalea sp. TaxID=2029877 RepID=UPI0032969BCD
MMPDLGKYSDTVLSAYGATIVLLVLLVLVSVWQSRRAKAALAEVEARRNG